MNIGKLSLDKNQINALVFGFLVLLLPVAVYLASNVTKDYRSKAAPSAYLELVPRAPQINGVYYFSPNDGVVVDIKMHTGSVPAEGYLFQVLYDPNELTVVDNADVTCGPDKTHHNDVTYNYLDNTIISYVTIENGIGKASAFCIGGTTISDVIMNNKVPANSPDEGYFVGSIKFKTNSETLNKNSITFDKTVTQIYEYGWFNNTTPTPPQEKICDKDPDNNTRDCELILIPDSLQPISYIIAPTPTSTPTPTNTPSPTPLPPTPTNTPVPSKPKLSLTTSTPTVNSDDYFTVDVTVDSAGRNITGVDAVINFDPDVLEVTNISTPNPDPSKFSTWNSSSFDNTKGEINISALVDTENKDGFIASGDLVGSIEFHVKESILKSQISNIKFIFIKDERNDSNISDTTGSDILASVDNLSIQINPSVINTPTPTNTPIPTPTNTPIPTPTNTPIPTLTPVPKDVTLHFTIDMQGRSWNTGLLKRLTTIKIKNINNNNWNDVSLTTNTDGSANAIFNNLFLGETYEVVVWPKGFLNQKMTITNLKTLQPTLNFDKQFEAGDLDESGKVNALDYNKLMANYKKESQDIAGENETEIADLDGSKQVNSLDFSLLLSNWNKCGAIDNNGNPITPSQCNQN